MDRNFFFFCTDEVGEETIQIKSRYLLCHVIYFPAPVKLAAINKYKAYLNGFKRIHLYERHYPWDLTHCPWGFLKTPSLEQPFVYIIKSRSSCISWLVNKRKKNFQLLDTMIMRIALRNDPTEKKKYQSKKKRAMKQDRSPSGSCKQQDDNDCVTTQLNEPFVYIIKSYWLYSVVCY